MRSSAASTYGSGDGAEVYHRRWWTSRFIPDAVWLDDFANITPVFFIETLAELALRATRSGWTPCDLVMDGEERDGPPNLFKAYQPRDYRMRMQLQPVMEKIRRGPPYG